MTVSPATPLAVSPGLSRVESFFDPATFTATHLVSDPATGDAVIIDPVLDYDPAGGRLAHDSARALLAAVSERGLTVRFILETHAHADHLTAGDWLRRQTGAKLVIGDRIGQVQQVFAPLFEAGDMLAEGGDFDILLGEGASLPLGSLAITAFHTPGHTPACMTWLVGDAAFVGDTLFMPDYGTARTDFPGGDAATLYRSIRRILALPPETRLFLGHDYLPAGRTAYQVETSVAAERAGNIHIHDGVSEAEFVAMREARDATLAPPRLLLPSLQVNIRGGRLPPPTAAGHVYLRTPITAA